MLQHFDAETPMCCFFHLYSCLTCSVLLTWFVAMWFRKTKQSVCQSFSSISVLFLFPFYLFSVFLNQGNAHTCIHTDPLSSLAWPFSREFWNLAAGFPWKTLMGKAVVFGAFDGRVWLHTVRQAKHVLLVLTFVLPADSEWLFNMVGKVRERGRTTWPNLNYKATLQTTCPTLLIPSSLYVHCHCYSICFLSCTLHMLVFV